MITPVSSQARAARIATWIYFTLNGFAIGIWVVHIPEIERRTHISHSTLGGLLLVLGLAAFIGMRVAGPVVDRFGQRWFLPTAGVLLGITLFGPGLARSWWELGLALAAIVGAIALRAGISTAITLSCCGILCVVVSLIAGRFLIEANHAVITDKTISDATNDQNAPPTRLVWLLGGLAFAMMLAEGVANDWAALHFKEVLGTSNSTAALAYGSFAVAMTIGRFGIDRIVAVTGPVAIVRYGALLAAVGLTIVMFTPWVGLAVVGWALFGFGLAGGVPQLFSAAGNLDTRSSGALMARVVGLGYVGLLAGPALIDSLTHWVPLNVTFLCLLFCVLLLRPSPTCLPLVVGRLCSRHDGP